MLSERVNNGWCTGHTVTVNLKECPSFLSLLMCCVWLCCLIFLLIFLPFTEYLWMARTPSWRMIPTAITWTTRKFRKFSSVRLSNSNSSCRRRANVNDPFRTTSSTEPLRQLRSTATACRIITVMSDWGVEFTARLPGTVSVDWLIVRMFDWLIVRMIDWLIVWSLEFLLIDWLMEGLIDWLID